MLLRWLSKQLESTSCKVLFCDRLGSRICRFAQSTGKHRSKRISRNLVLRNCECLGVRYIESPTCLTKTKRAISHMHFHHNPTRACAIKIKTIIGEWHRKPRATFPWLFWAWLVCIRRLQLKQWCQITSRFKSYFVGWYWWIRSTKPLDFLVMHWDSLRCSSHKKNRAWHWYQPSWTVLASQPFSDLWSQLDQTSTHRWQPFRLTQIYHNGGIAMWHPVLPNGSKMFKMIFIMIFKNDSGKIMWFIIIPAWLGSISP